MNTTILRRMTTRTLSTNENIVDGNMDELHEIADQTHGNESDSGSGGSLSELYP